MRLCLCTDLEGVAGVMNFKDWTHPGALFYEQARRLLTEEVNAAARGFFEIAGDDLEILVSDGHGSGAIDPEVLDERLSVTRGRRPSPWPSALGDDIDVAAIVGQHAKSGTPFSHLTHTDNSKVLEFTVNGFAVGEYGRSALCAAELGIPFIFAAGELAFTREAQEITPGVETVAVKEGLSPDDGGATMTADEYRESKLGVTYVAPKRARKMIYEGAKRAMRRYLDDPKSFGYRRFETPWRLVERYRSVAPGLPPWPDCEGCDDSSYIAALNRLAANFSAMRRRQRALGMK